MAGQTEKTGGKPRETAKPLLGGQAVIEGVMMRGPSTLAIAVRRPDGTIALSRRKLAARANPVLKWPIVRGCVAFIDTLRWGIDALLYSANESSPDDEQLSRADLTVAVALAFGLVILLFFVAPTLAMHFLHGRVRGAAALNLVEGLIRLLFFLAYLAVVARAKDVQRVLAYHGAEHKAIHCYEAGLPLTPENARRFSTLHPRCGTAFLLIVFVIAIIVYSFFGWPHPLLRVAVRMALLPVIAGIAYEVLKYLARSRSWAARALVQPGLLLQRFTTREPDDSMLEVAIAALQAVRDAGDDVSV